jgi:hypothetical protein
MSTLYKSKCKEKDGQSRLKCGNYFLSDVLQFSPIQNRHQLLVFIKILQKFVSKIEMLFCWRNSCNLKNVFY